MTRRWVGPPAWCRHVARCEPSSGRRLAGVGAVAMLLAAGCADHDEQSLCNAYAAYLVVADGVYAADPTGATADEAADAIEVLLGELTQLRAVADSRYRAPIDELEAVLDDLENTLDALPDEADYDTWKPLVDATLDDAAIADARLRRVVDPACAAVGDPSASGAPEHAEPLTEEN